MKAKLSNKLRESAIQVGDTGKSLCIIPIYIFHEQCTPEVMRILIELDNEVEGYAPNPIFIIAFVRLDSNIVFDVIETTDQKISEYLEITYCGPIMEIVKRANCYVLKKHVELI